MRVKLFLVLDIKTNPMESEETSRVIVFILYPILRTYKLQIYSALQTLNLRSAGPGHI